jgi:sec-independent protein translocase protein TatA
VIALVVLGPKKLPDMGRSVGKGMREFKDAISGDDHSDDQQQLAALHAEHESEKREPAGAGRS